MRHIALLLAVTCAQAQIAEVFSRPPAHVDESALRDRVGKFYQAHVDKKYRQAEEYVAPDTKDYYYEMEKRSYKEFSIAKIEYSDNYTHAKVTANVLVDWQTPRMGTIEMTAPLESTWKIVDGLWYWYYVKPTHYRSPFGIMGIGGSASGGAKVNSTPRVTKQLVQSKVQLSSREVRIESKTATSAWVEVINNLPGEVNIRLDKTTFPGLKVSLEREHLNPNERAKVLFAYTPGQVSVSDPIIVNVKVSPTNQTLPIMVVLPESNTP